MKTIGVAIATLALLLVAATAVAAQEDEAMPAGDPAVYFTGTFEELPPELPVPVMNPETGVLEIRDGRLEFISEAGDPRTEGPYAVDPFHMDIDPTTGVGRMWGTGHIENDDGSWDGTVRGMHYPVAEGVDGYTAFGVLSGSGAYEGLTYSYRASFDGEDASVEAIIYEGEPAPVE
ncbi:MAG: hypothetical protein AB1Z63_03195 [Candidatus Limnocylindrales bacterium]